MRELFSGKMLTKPAEKKSTLLNALKGCLLASLKKSFFSAKVIFERSLQKKAL